MSSLTFDNFECQMYVSTRGVIAMGLPPEAGPRLIARLEPMAHDKLIDPGFRRLLAAFEEVGNSKLPHQTVQV